MIKFLIHYRVPYLKEEMFCVMAKDKYLAKIKSFNIIKEKCDVCFENYIECIEFSKLENLEVY